MWTVRRTTRGHRALALVAVGVGVLVATPDSALARRSATPHMDKVEAAMRAVAPALEGTAYARTHGNRVIGYDGGADTWLIDTPGCFGQPSCADPVGIRRFLQTLESDLAKARKIVDITTLLPFPYGPFHDAIVRGLRRSFDNGNTPLIRILGGCGPGCSLVPGAVTAQDYADKLAGDIVAGADRLRVFPVQPQIITAAYQFEPAGTPAAMPGLGWNHSKITAIDGRVTLVGGHNFWSDDYIQGYPASPVTNPVHDTTMRVEGPAAGASHAFANVLWAGACAHVIPASAGGLLHGAELGFSTGTPKRCVADVRPPTTRGKGSVDVLGMGRLGLLGVQSGDRLGLGNQGNRSAPDDPAPCPSGLPYYGLAGQSPDWTNDPAYERVYDPRNPAEAGVHALIASAKSSVLLIQQDLLGLCSPGGLGFTPAYDRDTLDAIAGRLIAGVAVRVVISTPGSGPSALAPYSNSKSIAQTIAAIQTRTRVLVHDGARAAELVKQHLELWDAKFNASGRWPAAKPSYSGTSLHTKSILVDGCALYIGSENLYPSWVSEYGLLTEDRRTAASFVRQYAAPLWKYSAHKALSRGGC